jgi:hypothetical protein
MKYVGMALFALRATVPSRRCRAPLFPRSRKGTGTYIGTFAVIGRVPLPSSTAEGLSLLQQSAAPSGTTGAGNHIPLCQRLPRSDCPIPR